jgi:translation elongation factor P/translation initiation factor 5A
MTDLKKLRKGNYIIHENEACVIKDVQIIPSKNNPVIKLELEGLFSGKHYNSHVLTHQNIQEANLTRKCGTIISKKKNKIEIMDSTTFETFKADINPELLEKAQEGDNITYIHSDTSTRILEVRK